jgi:hypothetical protein
MISEGIQSIAIKHYGVTSSALYNEDDFEDEAHMVGSVLASAFRTNTELLNVVLEVLASRYDMDALERDPTDAIPEDEFTIALTDLARKYRDHCRNESLARDAGICRAG